MTRNILLAVLIGMGLASCNEEQTQAKRTVNPLGKEYVPWADVCYRGTVMVLTGVNWIQLLGLDGKPIPCPTETAK